jgi:hypothetical protein
VDYLSVEEAVENGDGKALYGLQDSIEVDEGSFSDGFVVWRRDEHDVGDPEQRKEDQSGTDSFPAHKGNTR